MHSVNEIRAIYGDGILVEAAQAILSERLIGKKISSPSDARDYVHAKIGAEEREHFMVVFLSAQNEVLSAEIMFSGTLSQTSVYPREVVRRALHHNCASVILAHNHPSGTVEPSSADEYLTCALKSALTLVDVKVLDHLIVAKGAKSVSFAERGLL